jgi:hypothetical protein
MFMPIGGQDQWSRKALDNRQYVPVYDRIELLAVKYRVVWEMFHKNPEMLSDLCLIPFGNP